MSTAALGAAGATGWDHVRSAWASLQRRELGWFLLLGLGYGLIDVSGMRTMPEGLPQLAVYSRHLLAPLLISLLLIPFWLPAARSEAAHPHRPWRLAAAAALGATAAMALLWPVVRLLDWRTLPDHLRVMKGEPAFNTFHWSPFLGDVLSVFVPALLAFCLFDALQRRAQRRMQLQQALQDQARLAREALSARLAALQAQVEPQFLFDTLVEIEQAYARRDDQAPARLERLIQHLRVALPRLRDGVTTLASETELLHSWLDVARDRWPDTPTLHTNGPGALATAPLPPMLLLPLLQDVLARARARQQMPGRVRLQAQALPAGGLRLQLALDRPGLCPAAALLPSLTERARSLLGAPVQLACDDTGAQTRYTLELSA